MRGRHRGGGVTQTKGWLRHPWLQLQHHESSSTFWVHAGSRFHRRRPWQIVHWSTRSCVHFINFRDLANHKYIHGNMIYSSGWRLIVLGFGLCKLPVCTGLGAFTGESVVSLTSFSPYELQSTPGFTSGKDAQVGKEYSKWKRPCGAPLLTLVYMEVVWCHSQTRIDPTTQTYSSLSCLRRSMY